jgi:sarcosine oxidase subunit alpha
MPESDAAPRAPRQVLWPELDVQLASVTEQWAQYAIAGPKSRQLLERLSATRSMSRTPDSRISHASSSNGEVCARDFFRISFSGELAYELAVPARCAMPR